MLNLGSTTTTPDFRYISQKFKFLVNSEYLFCTFEICGRGPESICQEDERMFE